MRRAVTLMLSALAVSALFLTFDVNDVQGQSNVQRGNINSPCAAARIPIWNSGTPNVCPPVTIDIRNTGTCAIEVLYRCAGQDMARFGPQPGQRVIQTFQADSIYVTCQEIPNSTRCRAHYVIRW